MGETFLISSNMNQRESCRILDFHSFNFHREQRCDDKCQQKNRQILIIIISVTINLQERKESLASLTWIFAKLSRRKVTGQQVERADTDGNRNEGAEPRALHNRRSSLFNETVPLHCNSC